jgi:hypothetical protein
MRVKAEEVMGWITEEMKESADETVQDTVGVLSRLANRMLFVSTEEEGPENL